MPNSNALFHFSCGLVLVTTLHLTSLRALAQAAEDEPMMSKIVGKVVCQDQAKFEAKTIAKIQLADVSLADASAIVIAEIEIADLKAFPIEFELPYDPQRIRPGLMYSLMIRIETDGRLDYINDTRIEPFEEGKPAENLEAPVIAIRR